MTSRQLQPSYLHNASALSRARCFASFRCRSSRLDLLFSSSFFPKDINLGVLKSIGTTCAGMRGRVGAGACSAVGGRQHGRGPAGRVPLALSRSGSRYGSRYGSRSRTGSHISFENGSLDDFETGRELYRGDVGENGCFP